MKSLSQEWSALVCNSQTLPGCQQGQTPSRLYLSLIRSVADYAASTLKPWVAPYSSFAILEKVQKNAIRANRDFCSSIETLFAPTPTGCHFQSLAFRRGTGIPPNLSAFRGSAYLALTAQLTLLTLQSGMHHHSTTGLRFRLRFPLAYR